MVWIAFQMNVKKKLNESYPESLKSSVEFQSFRVNDFTLTPEVNIPTGKKLKSNKEGENYKKLFVKLFFISPSIGNVREIWKLWKAINNWGPKLIMFVIYVAARIPAIVPCKAVAAEDFASTFRFSALTSSLSFAC